MYFATAESVPSSLSRSGCALLSVSAFFSLLSLVLLILSLEMPWWSIKLSGYSYSECSASYGVIYYGFSGNRCPSSALPRFGSNSYESDLSGDFYTLSRPAQGFIVQAIIFHALALTSACVSARRFSASASGGTVPKLHFGTPIVVTALSATAYALNVLGVVLAALFMSTLRFSSSTYVFGGASTGAYLSLVTSMVAFILPAVAKCRVREVDTKSNKVYVMRGTASRYLCTPPSLLFAPHTFLSPCTPHTLYPYSSRSREDLVSLLGASLSGDCCC